jgi:hypothetical protein
MISVFKITCLHLSKMYASLDIDFSFATVQKKVILNTQLVLVSQVSHVISG